MGAVFEGLTPGDLHAHIRYVADGMPSHRAEIILASPGVEIPVLRQTYVRMPAHFGLLLRVSSVGRPALDQLVQSLQGQGMNLKLRKSAKRRLISQCMPYWSVADPSYPLQAVGVLRTVCDSLNFDWPPDIWVVYSGADVNSKLPGTLRRDLAWEAGRVIGRILGRVIGDR